MEVSLELAKNSTGLDFQLSDFNADLTEPDVMLPDQFFEGKESGLTGAERNLMAAILADGIEAYINHRTAPSRKRKPRLDACEWVEQVDHSYVFSFDNVCESLGINPDYLRIGLSRYLSAKIAKGDLGSSAVQWKKIRRPRK